jgi:alcohol dehydrogenase
MPLSPPAFDFHFRTRLVFGLHSIDRLGELAREIGSARALVVTDPGIVAAGHVERALVSLKDAGIAPFMYDAVRENPTTRDVDRCVEAARETRADLLIGLGGGSSMDTAKGCNFILTNGGRMQDYRGTGLATRPMLPMIAVPTTAGTGSECQSYALIADEETHQKMACGDPKAAPRVALLDPALTVSQPRSVTAYTGIDAIAHALETAVTRHRNDVSSLFSKEAFRRTANHIRRALDDPVDLDARAQMQIGAAYAGLAIESSMLGAAHSAANPLTAHYGIIHGQAVGTMLPHIVRFNAADPVSASIYKDFAVGAGIASENSTPHEAVGRLADALDTLLHHAGFPASLADTGVNRDMIPVLANEAARQWTAQFNPRLVSAADFEELYRAAF